MRQMCAYNIMLRDVVMALGESKSHFCCAVHHYSIIQGEISVASMLLINDIKLVLANLYMRLGPESDFKP